MFIIRFRCFHSSSLYLSSNKNLLSKLRKTTGFSFVNCKEALDKFDNDIKKAEKYLKERAQKEGWTKATKLQGRSMSQGLIGIIMQNNAASIVEVNCETDFVSRNLKFKNFTTLVCSALHFHGLEFSKQKIHYGCDEMASLEMNSKKISDLMALEIGSLGENIIVRRGIFVKALPNQHISYYIHETGPKIDSFTGLCNFGKYGALVVFSKNENMISTDEDVTILSADQIGRELCQHIVGMNPLCIDREDPPMNENEAERSIDTGAEHRDEALSARLDSEARDKLENDAGEEHRPEEEEKNNRPPEEDRLLRQEFILNSDITVGHYLREQGVDVVDFIRLECGEESADDDKQIARQQSAAS